MEDTTSQPQPQHDSSENSQESKTPSPKSSSFFDQLSEYRNIQQQRRHGEPETDQERSPDSPKIDPVTPEENETDTKSSSPPTSQPSITPSQSTTTSSSEASSTSEPSPTTLRTVEPSHSSSNLENSPPISSDSLSTSSDFSPFETSWSDSPRSPSSLASTTTTTTTTTTTSTDTPTESESSTPTTSTPGSENLYECNICLDPSSEPVITLCGHLFCWSCIYRWLQQQGGASRCPVCHSGISQDKLIPIYGRDVPNIDPRKNTTTHDIPQRPRGQRSDPPPSPHMPMGGFSPFVPPTPTQTLAEQQQAAILSRLLFSLGTVVILCLLFF